MSIDQSVTLRISSHSDPQARNKEIFVQAHKLFGITITITSKTNFVTNLKKLIRQHVSILPA